MGESETDTARISLWPFKAESKKGNQAMKSQNPSNGAPTSEAASEGRRRPWRTPRRAPLARLTRIGRTKRKKKPEVSEIPISGGWLREEVVIELSGKGKTHGYRKRARVRTQTPR